jgi:hypothetical protein
MTKSCIYLIANKKSQRDFLNLVYSIKASGCKLDINLIPFGGEPISKKCLPSGIEICNEGDFSREAITFVDLLQKHLKCPRGFLLRFLPFFGKYDHFIYSDNDIVALCDWNELIDPLYDYDLVHADQEFKTGGRYNFFTPSIPELEFGPTFHQAAITAGHFAAKKSTFFLDSIHASLEWMIRNQSACILHDQTLMHLAIFLGGLRTLNLCKPPHQWLSSWAGDYTNTLELIQLLQQGNHISHLHYSGGPTGLFENPIDELLLSSLSHTSRHQLLIRSSFMSYSHSNLAFRFSARAARKIKALFSL